MKQFQYTKPSGKIYAAYDIHQAQQLTFKLHAWFDSAAVGETALDADGDLWERLPDLVQQDTVPLTVEEFAVRPPNLNEIVAAERLERIATAALQGLLAGSTANVVLMSELNKSGIDPFPRLASDAHLAAKALIAELDKQS